MVEINQRTRANKVIMLAGGTTNEVNLDSVNLAEVVHDGMKIHVPKVGEEPPLQEEDKNQKPTAANTPDSRASSGSSDGKKININSVSEQELTSLPRVDPATAKKIIDYRESSGSFKSVEDLTQVPGIGQKTLENLLPMITL